MFNDYTYYQNFILRTPKQSLKFGFDLLDQDKLLWTEYLNDISFQEALYLASPELIKVSENYQKLSHKKKCRLEKTLLKYLIRSATRCTPFGLFSGCSIGRFNNKIRVDNLKQITRYTSVDMNVLTEVAEKLIDIDEIKLMTKFSPNNSLYQIGNNYRFIACYFKNKHKKYKLENVQKGYYLKKVLEFSVRGKKVSEIYNFICDLSKTKDDYVSIDNAASFVDELINNQLLIPEISPSIIGGDYFNRLINHLENIQPKQAFEKNLKHVHASLVALDIHKANAITDYRKIIHEINKIGISEKRPYYFQVDHFQQFAHNTLSKKIPLKILKGIEVLSRFSSHKEKDYLDLFKDAFIQRYGCREIPLSNLFDEEVGLKFQHEKMYNEFDLIDDFQMKESGGDISLSEINKDVIHFFLSKYEEILKNDLHILEITDSDLKEFPKNTKKPLSHTFSVLIELYKDPDKELFFLSSAGGSTALNLISRFSQQSKEIAAIVGKVVENESDYDPDKIIAEINHLPENRTGNILKSRVNRSYEIVYLSNSHIPFENQILVNDLYVSIRSDTVRLRSKKLDKEIIPILSNAHNFDTVDSLPIYVFLCKLQFQDKKEAINFLWPDLFLNFNFLPRVQYKDMIFSKAQWKLKYSEVENLENLADWCIRRKIPQYIQIQEHDKFLLLNLKNGYCIELLKSHCKKNQEIWVTEYLFTTDMGLPINNEVYANEFIISYYRKNYEAA